MGARGQCRLVPAARRSGGTEDGDPTRRSLMLEMRAMRLVKLATFAALPVSLALVACKSPPPELDPSPTNAVGDTTTKGAPVPGKNDPGAAPAPPTRKPS